MTVAIAMMIAVAVNPVVEGIGIDVGIVRTVVMKIMMTMTWV
jgi:hypothetical protein